MAFTASDRCRARIREEMARKNLNQTDLANLLKWTQSRMSKILNGRTQLGVDELAELCWVVGLSMPEVVRDHGLEFCAEMTPTELRMLENLRTLPAPVRDAVFTLLKAHSTTTPDRHAKPIVKNVIPKGRHAR